MDGAGHRYVTDCDDRAMLKTVPAGKAMPLAQHPRFVRLDALWITTDGKL